MLCCFYGLGFVQSEGLLFCPELPGNPVSIVLTSKMSDPDLEATEALMSLRGDVDTSEDQENLDTPDPEVSKNSGSEEMKHVIRKPDSLIECKYCHHVCSGGVTRVRAHLSKLPGAGIISCPKVPENVMLRMRELTRKVAAKRKAMEERKKTMSSLVPTPFTSTGSNINHFHIITASVLTLISCRVNHTIGDHPRNMG